MEIINLYCKAINHPEHGEGLLFSSECPGLMLRFVAQAQSEALEYELIYAKEKSSTPQPSIFIATCETTQEHAQSFIDDWFNPECVVLQFTNEIGENEAEVADNEDNREVSIKVSIFDSLCKEAASLIPASYRVGMEHVLKQLASESIELKTILSKYGLSRK